MQRKPSHFGSYSTPPGTLSGSGISLTDFASIGLTGGITGRRMAAVCQPGRRRARLEGGHALRGAPAGRAVPAVVGAAPPRRRAGAVRAVRDVVDAAGVVLPHP